MCHGSCTLYSTQIEDWIGIDKPVNVPGTFREYPNWKENLQLIWKTYLVTNTFKSFAKP